MQFAMAISAGFTILPFSRQQVAVLFRNKCIGLCDFILQAPNNHLGT
jgi:hypothetical protein